MLILILVVGAGLAIWAIALYNLLVRDRARVAAAWSDVGVQLKRRHDLIPQLVETVKQHAGYERGVLERIVASRNNAQATDDPAQRRAPESALTRDVPRLLAVAENYPELKASASFLNLQRNLTEVEEQIQFARRYYNGAVNNLNTRVDTVPDVFIARLFGFRAAEYFELDGADEAQPASIA